MPLQYVRSPLLVIVDDSGKKQCAHGGFLHNYATYVCIYACS